VDRGFFLTWHAIRSQLAAMPNELYLIRLIHHQTRRAFPGERLWTAGELLRAATIRFLRVRNGEGCDVYIQPYAGNQNAGYILVDLDRADRTVVEVMRANGHDPCVVLQTSPGHLQAWIRLSTSPLEPAVATAAGRLLACSYDGDFASTDWRHLGRLAGFTNQKPARRTADRYAPWVKLIYGRVGLAPRAEALLQSVRQCAPPLWHPTSPFGAEPGPTSAEEAATIYRSCTQRWHILERFPQPDWSIVDLWVARYLLSQGQPAPQIQAILRLASPHFPRRHGDPDGYLRRTVARAAFPSPGRAVCGAHARASAPLETSSARSNSTGGR
jgi:RepB DNA-primase N-terminal domain/RepB DNA-primase C-terminal helical domain